MGTGRTAGSVVQARAVGAVEMGRSGCFWSVFSRLRNSHQRLDAGAEGTPYSTGDGGQRQGSGAVCIV